MSRLEELFDKLCPNGIEYKKVGEVCVVLTGGEAQEDAIKSKEPIGENIYPIYSNGIGENSLWGFSKEYRIDRDAVTFSSIGTIGFPTVRKAKFTPIIRLKVLYPIDENQLNLYFLKYALEIVKFEQQKSSVPNVNANMIKNLEIPVPPIEVQEEIVRILDNFTELTAKLITELTAELQDRKKQYEYYRDSLLTFSSDISNVNLSDLCDIKGRIGFRGYTSNDIVKQGEGAISLSPSNIFNQTINYDNCTYITWNKYFESPEIMISENDIIVCKTGSTVGKVAIVRNMPEKSTLNPQMVVLKNIKCNCHYLYFWLTNYTAQNYILSNAGIGSVPNISQEKLGKLPVSIPSIEEQERIVSILNKFDKYCNDISEGLPAEIELRQKQYEYYRDKLLTFKRAN